MDSNFHTSQVYSKTLSASKVYVNPNFPRTNSFQNQSNSVHINPLFPHNPNLQSTSVNKSKIYVNPNFVNTKIARPSSSHHQGVVPPLIPNSSHNLTHQNQTVTSISYHDNNININNCDLTQITNRYSLPSSSLYGSYNSVHNRVIYATSSNFATTSHQSLPSTTPIILSNKFSANPIPSAGLTKSRYAIVRQNNSTPSCCKKTSELQPVAKLLTKLKINKYKTVTIDHAKKNIETEKVIQKVRPKLIISDASTPVTVEKYKRVISPRIVQSRFKLVKKTIIQNKVEIKTPIRRRQSLTNSKIIVRMTKNTNLKVTNKKKFKLNNIPCPLFKKFGKCLRAEKGTCELLHDKKHVSICRQFLKGACHNTGCLLSHELTAKKMPTCYFYLKGMCTKEDCPYLHVKLNDKAKICTDFLKGYCEKADKCLNRHINICPELANKGSCTKIQCPYSHGNKNKKLIYKNKSNGKSPSQARLKLDKRKICRKKSEVDSEAAPLQKVKCEQKETKDSRYYKDVVENESDTSLENIKPSRCKLGDLPSFIGL